MEGQTETRARKTPFAVGSGEFRATGHALVDRIAELLESLPARPVTPAAPPVDLREALHADRPLPERGVEIASLLNRAADLLFETSLFNGHPRFWGYITSSPTPIGMLGELLAAAVNPNVGAWPLSPMASEIEAQTIRWIAELLGYPVDCGGLFVSGGNMANIVGFLAARKARAGHDVRKEGIGGTRLRAYCSKETHTWIEKAADISGIGTDAIRWIDTNEQMQIDIAALCRRIEADLASGDRPFLIVGAAGTVSTGAVDPLHELAEVCHRFGLWFHVDGAYGALAAILPDAPSELAGLGEADSIAVDPHKWLYAPLEAGCALVRDRQNLRDAFSYHPPYYHFETEATNYYDLGPQNSRGFRALKVWLALQQAGREGYVQSISEDIRLAAELFRLVSGSQELEAFTRNLSIATFRYVPPDLARSADGVDLYLDKLNNELVTRLQNSGEAYISNAIVRGMFALRACIVNFRTTLADVEALPPLVIRIGREVDAEIRPKALR